MKNKNIQNIKIVTLALILALGISYASAAWTPAPSSPPNSNTDAPINVGVSKQAKVGGMAVGTSSLQNLIDGYSFAVPSGISLFKTIVGSVDLVMYGKIGAGVPNYATGQWPSVTLDVNGDSWIRGNIKVSGTRTLNNVVYAPGPGKILTSADTLGTVYWATPSTSSSGGSSKWATSTINTANIHNGNLSGNVGIGTNDPTAKLEVAGAVKITGGSPGVGKVLTSDATGLASWSALSSIPGSGGSSKWATSTNGTDIYNGNLSGEVGIGTNNPTTKLDVAGRINSASTNGSGGYISTGNYGGTVSAAYFPLGLYSSTGPNWLYGTNYTNSIIQDTTNRFLINPAGNTFFNGGNVGIGTTDPTAKLDVAGNMKIGNYYFDGNGYSGTDDGWLRLLASDNGAYKGLAVGSQYISGNLTTIGSASIAGDVGIGTVNPSTKLEVVGTVKATGLQITGGTGPLTGKVLTSDSNGVASWQAPVSSQTIRWDKWVKYRVINSDADWFHNNNARNNHTYTGCSDGWITKDTITHRRYLPSGLTGTPGTNYVISETTCVRVDPTYSSNAMPSFTFESPLQTTTELVSTSPDPYGP